MKGTDVKCIISPDIRITDISWERILLHVTIETDAAKDLILESGYDVKFGARPLKRAIRSLLEDKLAKLALTGKITENAQITADADGDEITLTVN